MDTPRNNLKIIDDIGLLQHIKGDVAQEVEDAIRRYEKFHWGLPYGKVINFTPPEVPETVFAIGEVALIGYASAKGDDGTALWIHGFHNPPPVLCCDKNGQLYVVGGIYKIEQRGIVN